MCAGQLPWLLLPALVALGCPGGVPEPQVGKEQAVAVASRQVLFEPESIEAELTAEANPPVWRVTLRGRLPGQSVFEFEEATVTVDAVTGDVIGVGQQEFHDTIEENSMNAMNWVGASGRRLSVVALAGLVLALAAGVLALFAALGYRTGALDLGTSFSFLRWGARTGLAALGVSLVGLVLTVVRGRGGPLDDLAPGVAAGGLAIAIGAVSYAIPAQQQSIARSVPPIHDITTDMENPPEFVDVLPLRADAPNPPEYDPEIASQQREGYPDLGPIILDDPPAAVFQRALAAVHALGWDLVGDDADAGRIEATDTTFWYGFKDDVVVRIRPAGSGSRVDVRSKSRVGGSDVGANAARIQTFAERLTGG